MNFLTLNYWFDMRPAPLIGAAQKGLFAFSIVLAAMLIAAVIITKKGKAGAYQKIVRKLESFFSINLFIGLLLSFFTYELIPFLSSRFWLLLWLIEMAVWLYFIGKILLNIPKRIEELKKEQEIKKYLP